MEKGEFVGIMGASGQDITKLRENEMPDFSGKEIGFILWFDFG
ncbi:hypothetical protein HMPREF0493_0857 [Lactobacillus amylolyticus DSM 11664]|uniref:Uncharacterized protein n=1 Tax=Lactobacillus amylolyticus DSM 11664 TaxID=585524 RepID=D4YTJ6_9LACO|nr:hypothetical protein HMPREF0493_0857 [Lactobacillus amylolyticus DSM 11664]